jgi:hypothetical protein
MGEGTVLQALATGQRVGGKVLRKQVRANLAVAADFQVVWQVRPLADEGDPL